MVGVEGCASARSEGVGCHSSVPCPVEAGVELSPWLDDGQGEGAVVKVGGMGVVDRLPMDSQRHIGGSGLGGNLFGNHGRLRGCLPPLLNLPQPPPRSNSLALLSSPSPDASAWRPPPLVFSAAASSVSYPSACP
ncbi:hypothetical protein ZIOFF_043918 [Zingiber officinale]|uniref:Uncharacterized protein n=1 Tax=Zingiber officinale TaxID=94328 RepID=A0A8J5FU91_ZINOF|nr:hypothetical protein ZIOFF_043918 [Zingiber officinale]